MNQITIKYISIIYLFFFIYLKKNYVHNIKTSRNLDIDKLNFVEKLIIRQGILMPVTSSWQLLLILLSGNDYGLSLTHKIRELSESKNQTVTSLGSPYRFHLHPASSISSSILIYPRYDFLEFAITFIGTLNYMELHNAEITSSLVNERRNFIACNSMIRSMLKNNFLTLGTEQKNTSQKRPGGKESPVGHLCEEYLMALNDFFNKLVKIKRNTVRCLQAKVHLYNRICEALDHSN